MPQVIESDADVVRRVKRGDEEAYRILIDRYAPMIFNILRGYCQNEADVEDLAQDTFVRAYEGLERFRGEAQFSSWLYQIAVNRGKDFVKSARQRRCEDADPATIDEALISSSTPHRNLVTQERAAQVRQALDEIAPDYAAAFTLKYEMGLPYKEMAEVMDSTVGALRVRVHRARKQLKTNLAGKL